MINKISTYILYLTILFNYIIIKTNEGFKLGNIVQIIDSSNCLKLLIDANIEQA